MNFATAGWERRRRRRARRASTAFRPARTPDWAISCRRASCASTCATNAAIRSSSARAASITRRWDRPCRWPPGDAFDVKVRAVVDKRTRLSTFDWQSDMRYEFTNALPRPVTVKLLQEGLWGDSRITAESQKSTRRSADTAEWAGDGARQRQGQPHRHLRHAILGLSDHARPTCQALGAASRHAPGLRAGGRAGWRRRPGHGSRRRLWRPTPWRRSHPICRSRCIARPIAARDRSISTAWAASPWSAKPAPCICPPGVSRLRFEGVADGIEPASAIVTGLPGGVIEKNREGKLLAHRR